MRTNCLILFALFFSIFAKAQDNYTYISDRKFYDPEDLIGFDFRPEYMEIPDEVEQKLAPGSYSFGISRNNLYVDGGDLKGVYSVNNINPTEYGYKLLLMNARDPTLQGHLKVILNKYGQVEALVFKRSNKDNEIIFYQAQIPEKLWEEEKAFFTYKYDYEISNPDSIWGQKFYPFLRIHMDEGGVQQRLQMKDSTSIEFVERVTVIEKKKKSKDRKKDEIETEETVLENVDGMVLESDEGAVPPIEIVENDSLTEAEQLETVKVKIVKEYFVIVSSFQTYEDGSYKHETKEIQVKNKFTEYQKQGSETITEPYEIILAGDKKKEDVSIYLSPKRTISSISIFGKKYLMRGH